MKAIGLLLIIFLSIAVTSGWIWFKRQQLRSLPPQAKFMSAKGKGMDSWNLSEEEWRERLTPEQFAVLREQNTEPAFTGEYWDLKEPGVYHCAGCDLPLFSSATKYDSKTGWPSFWEPIKTENIAYHDDYVLFYRRVEVACARCGGHLGHQFDDGPPPTGKRYCINSVSLVFEPESN